MAQACKDKDAQIQIKEPCDRQCNYICKNDNCDCPLGYYQVPKTGDRTDKSATCIKDTGQILKTTLGGTPLACFKTAHIDGIRRLGNIQNVTVSTEHMGGIEFNRYVGDLLRGGWAHSG